MRYGLKTGAAKSNSNKLGSALLAGFFALNAYNYSQNVEFCKTIENLSKTSENHNKVNRARFFPNVLATSVFGFDGFIAHDALSNTLGKKP